VSLVLGIFNEKTVEALSAKTDEGMKNTAAFISVILNWWKIVKLRSAKHGIVNIRQVYEGLECEQSDTLSARIRHSLKMLCRRPWNSTSHVTSTHLCTLLGTLHLNVQAKLLVQNASVLCSGHRSRSNC